MANTSQTRNDKQGSVVESAKDLGKQIGNKADQATAAAGRGMQSAADTIRENTPDEGILGGAAEAVSKTVERGGRYLEEKKISGMMEDVTETIRSHPVPALLIAVGVGFLLARALSRD
jgi:ElaB/YqjD/DUF883 family membrane-anchored ribosome-binding protein